MTRPIDLRCEASCLLEDANADLKASADEHSAAGDSFLLGNLRAYRNRLKDAERFAAEAMRKRERARELVAKARSWEAGRRTCCAPSPTGEVCTSPVGHADEHREGFTTWANEERRAS